MLVVLAVSYASSLRAYLEQRRELASLHEQIASSKVAVAELRREKRRWSDDAFVEQQARERLGFVMPGETGYQVIGVDGKPLDADDSLTDPAAAEDALRPPWWETAWSTVENAGHPPSEGPPPATLITPPKGER